MEINKPLPDNFIHAQPGLTVRALGDSKVSVTSFTEEFGKEKTICSNRVSDVVETLAAKGFGYGSLLKIFREAKQSDTVNTRLVVNAVPKLGRTYTPDEFELPPETSDKYVAQPMPELFRNGNEKQKQNLAFKKKLWARPMRQSKRKTQLLGVE